MTHTLVPFATRLPRGFGDFAREVEGSMRRFLERDGNGDREPAMSFAPNLNVSETESGYEVSVDLPRMRSEEISVDFKDGALWITGERKSETEKKEKTYHRIERRYGSFRRVVHLGTDCDPDSIDASFKDGVLTILTNKTEVARSKRIEVHG